MKNQNYAELERLVSELYDDGLSPADMRRLEELLLDDPAAQRRYHQMVDSHIALCVAGGSAAAGQRSPAIGDGPREAVPSAPPADRSRSSDRLDPAWLLAAAAAVLLAVGLSIWSVHEAQRSGTPLAASAASQDLVATLPVITHVSWEGPTFRAGATEPQRGQPVTAGSATLQSDNNEQGDGYVIRLAPGMSVDLVASFDATGENSLSITELIGGPRPSVKKLTFHNAGDGPKPLHANPAAKDRRYGVLGHWSEINLDDRPRYFLLTGVHKLARANPDSQWRLSKMKVLLEHEYAVQIGWDDSGPAPVGDKPYQPDGDFDDLAASLFFAPLDDNNAAPRDGLEVLATNPIGDIPAPDVIEDSYEFELGPGAVAVVNAVCQATDPNAVVVLDAETRAVLWASPEHLAEEDYLGACGIRNNTDKPKALRLAAVNRPSNKGAAWRTSKMRVLYEQPRFLILGFEDSREDEDYNDIRLNLLIKNDRGDGA